MFDGTGSSSSSSADNCQDGVSTGSLRITKVPGCKISTGSTHTFTISGGTSPYTYSATCDSSAGTIDSTGKFTAVSAGAIGASGAKVSCHAKVTDTNSLSTDYTYFYVEEP
jgi:hypothetical protein